MNNGETWKNINEFYQVSDLGSARSLDRIDSLGRLRKGRVLVPYLSNSGYLFVKFCLNGKSEAHSIHRLVAEMFIPNPNNFEQVNHKDENKLNNRVENLEWCSVNYNINYGDRTKKASISKTNGKNSKPVVQYDLEGNFIKKWPSAAEAKRALKNSHLKITECCKGKYNKTGGYKWIYA